MTLSGEISRTNNLAQPDVCPRRQPGEQGARHLRNSALIEHNVLPIIMPEQLFTRKRDAPGLESELWQFTIRRGEV